MQANGSQSVFKSGCLKGTKLIIETVVLGLNIRRNIKSAAHAIH
jgi:hypothetical protein